MNTEDIDTKSPSNAFEVVKTLEDRVAEFSGSKYAVAVDSCTNALFLCLKYVNAKHVILPAKTYCSVPMAAVHAGCTVKFEDIEWKGVYQIKPYEIYDGAKRFKPGMYQGGLHCLSFHLKKIINIGRGGMILTNDSQARDWLVKARYDGRSAKPYRQEEITMMGWHMYMTPEQAARGLQLLDSYTLTEDLTEDYPDLRTFEVFNESRVLSRYG